MTMVEFYEAIARLAEKACFLPLEGIEGVENLEDEAAWPLAKRKYISKKHKIFFIIFNIYKLIYIKRELHLAYKMEGFLMKMF